MAKRMKRERERERRVSERPSAHCKCMFTIGRRRTQKVAPDVLETNDRKRTRDHLTQNVTWHPHHDDCFAPPQAQSSALFENAAQPPTSHGQDPPGQWVMSCCIHADGSAALSSPALPAMYVPAPRRPHKDERVGSPTVHRGMAQPSLQAGCRHRSLSPCSNAEKMMAGAEVLGGLCKFSRVKRKNIYSNRAFDESQIYRALFGILSASLCSLSALILSSYCSGSDRERYYATPNKQRSETRLSAALPSIEKQAS